MPSYRMRIASAKPRSARGASHCPVFMSNSLTISHTFLLFLPSLVLCCIAPYHWANNGASVDVSLDGEYGFTSIGSRCYTREWVF